MNGDGTSPNQNRHRVSAERFSGRAFQLAIVAGAFLIMLGVVGWIGIADFSRYFDSRDDLIGRLAVNAVVERIIEVESNGDPNAKNGRSSATGVGQFLDETWLDLIRMYRSDLMRAYNEKELLELRKETELAREMTMRFAERNATMLRRRGLPVTAETIYLAHFAGGAGAVAILSAPENTDAAVVMAAADSKGRTKRDQIVKANPFLEHFTVADLKSWAHYKMYSPRLRLTQAIPANERR
jgi:hypothetical protein